MGIGTGSTESLVYFAAHWMTSSKIGRSTSCGRHETNTRKDNNGGKKSRPVEFAVETVRYDSRRAAT